MSLKSNLQEELFTANNELEGFLPEDHLMNIFSKEIYYAFKDKDFKECYSEKGRNAKSPAFLARVTLLQFRENISDFEAGEACMMRIDWKIALHLPLDKKESFDPSLLCVFRRRLKENKKSSLILDKTVKLAQEKGFIKKRTKQRIDATHIIAHVNRISTTDLLFRAVKCLVEEIEKKDAEYYKKELPEHIKERYSKRFSSFGMSKEKRGDKQAEIVEDGLYLKSLLEKLPCKNIEDMKQLEIMETIFKENVIIKQKEVDEKIFIEAEEIKRPKQTIFDPRDTSIQLGKKGNKSWVGCKCHVVETAKRGEINFITDMIRQTANRSDQKIHEIFKQGNKRRRLKPSKLFADTNYISGKSIKEYRDEDTELMGYIGPEVTAKDEAFKVKKFVIDMNKYEATCPAGKKSHSYYKNKRGKIEIHFSKTICSKCCFFKECVGDNKKGRRQITITPYYDYTIERRDIQKTEQFREEMKVRAQVEGTISEGTRFHGLRHKKYKGEEGDKLHFYFIGAAINIKRLVKAINSKKNNKKFKKAS